MCLFRSLSFLESPDETNSVYLAEETDDQELEKGTKDVKGLQQK